MDIQMHDARTSLQSHDPVDTGQNRRKQVMSILASAEPESLSSAMDAFGGCPRHETIRAPETGLIMVRGRMGGTGTPFNLGEVTITRCAVRLNTGETGYSYILGRHKQHAHHAALFDALWQKQTSRQRVEDDVISILSAKLQQRQNDLEEETAATRVDFFTMVRGED